MNIFLSIIITVIGFSVMVVVHEFGHYIVAKKCGIQVNEFAIGMGPALYKHKGKETTFRINMIPFGGYCQMEGEDGDSDKENPRAFCSKTRGRRFLVLVAGASMNIILGVLLTFIVCMSAGGFVSTTVNEVQYKEQTKIMAGDKIVNIDGHPVLNYTDLGFAIQNVENTTFDAAVIRNGERVKLDDVPFIKTESGYKVGITLTSEKKTVGTVLKHTFTESLSVIRLVWMGLWYLITGRVGIGELTGPVGITGIVREYMGYGVLTVVDLFAMLSINLGVMNLLPFPALDGGRILMVIIETITRKPAPVKFETALNAVGFVLLMGLSAFVLVNDIFKVIR